MTTIRPSTLRSLFNSALSMFEASPTRDNAMRLYQIAGEAMERGVISALRGDAARETAIAYA